MPPPGATRDWSIVTFLLAILAFNPPVLTIFSVEVFLFGIPLLYLYLFAVWVTIVAMVAWIANAGGPDAGEDRDRAAHRSRHAQ
ncbi:MAG TPA: hypothetical protein VGA60_07800 [Kiloniellales bacterium]|jgi:fatty acid desaturase